MVKVWVICKCFNSVLHAFLSVKDDIFEIKNGLHVSNVSGVPVYNYSILEEFQHMGVDQPIKR